MRRADIKRLERAAYFLSVAEQHMDKAQESIWKRETEFIEISHQSMTTHDLVESMRQQTVELRKWVEGKINVIKEQANENKD